MKDYTHVYDFKQMPTAFYLLCTPELSSLRVKLKRCALRKILCSGEEWRKRVTVTEFVRRQRSFENRIHAKAKWNTSVFWIIQDKTLLTNSKLFEILLDSSKYAHFVFKTFSSTAGQKGKLNFEVISTTFLFKYSWTQLKLTTEKT